VVETAVDAMATPSGLAALMEGRAIWKHLRGGVAPTDQPEPEPLHDARYRFESPSTFSATVRSADGAPTVFVLRRQGLRWKLAEIRLPPP
jgi:hypothetical protein